jgi:hypothetical protein
MFTSARFDFVAGRFAADLVFVTAENPPFNSSQIFPLSSRAQRAGSSEAQECRLLLI